MSAGQDRLIPPSHSRDLVAALGGSAQLLEFSDNGHMVNRERPDEFNLLLGWHVRRASARAQGQHVAPSECDAQINKLLRNAGCRRYGAVEVREERWGDSGGVSLRILAGWAVRFFLVVPVMLAVRAIASVINRFLRYLRDIEGGREL
ncbi:hypothetical protein T484DRAFT_1828171 [Baffinella frigidus]|nr:hypothetical protein T484DRAFT_1828171 [Cryptophyta sp. CCMP2293]